MGPYSVDLRQRIVEAYANGEGSIRLLAKRFVVAPNTVQNYLTQLRATGTVVPLPHAGGVAPKIDQAEQQQLSQLVAEKNDRTLAELAEQLEQRLRLQVSVPTVHRALQRLGITRKKKRFGRASRTARRSVVAAPSFVGRPGLTARAV